MTGVELAGALMKPLYYLWQLVKGLLPRDDNTFRGAQKAAYSHSRYEPVCPAMGHRDCS
jgi:hypothetical protein